MIPVDAHTMLEIAPRFSGANGEAQATIVAAVGEVLRPTLERYAIDTRLRIAHFLGQTCVESAASARRGIRRAARPMRAARTSAIPSRATGQALQGPRADPADRAVELPRHGQDAEARPREQPGPGGRAGAVAGHRLRILEEPQDQRGRRPGRRHARHPADQWRAERAGGSPRVHLPRQGRAGPAGGHPGHRRAAGGDPGHPASRRQGRGGRRAAAAGCAAWASRWRWTAISARRPNWR